MNAPVSQKPVSEKITMTAPVGQMRENGRWRIAFKMPSAFTMNTQPIPDDERFSLRIKKEKTVTVIRYSGTWGKKRYENHANKRTDWIRLKGWKIVGDPVWARYDPPFMPWLLKSSFQYRPRRLFRYFMPLPIHAIHALKCIFERISPIENDVFQDQSVARLSLFRSICCTHPDNPIVDDF